MNCEHSRIVMGFLYALPRLPPYKMWQGFRTAAAYAQEKGVHHGVLEVFAEYAKNEWITKRIPEVVSVFGEQYSATQGMESKNFELNKKVAKHPPYWDCYCKIINFANFSFYTYLS